MAFSLVGVLTIGLHPEKDRVKIKTKPSCESLVVTKGGKEIRHLTNFKGQLQLRPGSYRFVCISKTERLRRFFRGVIKKTKKQQVLKREWQSRTFKLLLGPWAYTYINGYFYPQCQHACRVALWNGSNEVILKRALKGTSGQAIVHRRLLKRLHALRPSGRPLRPGRLRGDGMPAGAAVAGRVRDSGQPDHAQPVTC